MKLKYSDPSGLFKDEVDYNNVLSVFYHVLVNHIDTKISDVNTTYYKKTTLIRISIDSFHIRLFMFDNDINFSLSVSDYTDKNYKQTYLINAKHDLKKDSIYFEKDFYNIVNAFVESELNKFIKKIPH